MKIHVLTNDAWCAKGIEYVLSEHCREIVFYTAYALNECVRSLHAINSTAARIDVVIISIDDVTLLKALSTFITHSGLRIIVMLDSALDVSYVIYGWLCFISKKSKSHALTQVVSVLSRKLNTNATFISAQEGRVLSWLLQGHSNAWISAKMQVSVKTVSHMKVNVARKIGASGLNDIVLLRYMHLFHSSLYASDNFAS